LEERREKVRVSPEEAQGVAFFVQGETLRHFGLINDISEGGIGISVENNFAPGTILEITIEEDEQETYLIGEVRWCKADEWLEGSYHLGIATQIKLVT